MMHGYFEMANVSCRVISNISLSMCKIHVLAMPYLGIIGLSMSIKDKSLKDCVESQGTRL